MHMPKWSKILVSVFLILTTLVVSYAGHFDRIFGISLSIRASAASYAEKSKSMLDFYKSGSSLSKEAITGDEVYAFGVFVSNFFMPFQSAMGDLSGDAFATKMAQTFFGDAYTAEQFSDMKYTLGLVKTAQGTRRRLISKKGHGTVSVNTLYANFRGFFSEFFEASGNKAGTEVEYTYEGAEGEPTVWVVGLDTFDVVLGQVLSVAPTQAGVYFGTSGNLTSDLFIDCFGNISDGKGILIIPACMNPYAFYNKYLDENRMPLTEISNKCPLQLPINNAFWMGTMVTPGALNMRVRSVVGADTPSDDTSDTSDTTDTTSTSNEGHYEYQTKEGLVSLANLWYPLDLWTNSSTVTVGLDTMLGSYLAVYFNSSINDTFRDAWAVATNHTDVDYNTLMEQYLNQGKDGFFDAWAFTGGTTIPISAVLDNIALFDTYSNFSDSVAESISVMSMYRNLDKGTWWAADNLHGTHINSIATQFMEAASDVISSSEKGQQIINAGILYTMSTPASVIGDNNPIDPNDDTSGNTGYYNLSNAKKVWNFIVNTLAESDAIDKLGTSSEDISSDTLAARLATLAGSAVNKDYGFDKAKTVSEGMDLTDAVVEKINWQRFAGISDSGNLNAETLIKNVALTALVAVATGDPAWMTFVGGQGDWVGSDPSNLVAPLFLAIDFMPLGDDNSYVDAMVGGMWEAMDNIDGGMTRRGANVYLPFDPGSANEENSGKGGYLSGRPIDYEKARKEAANFWKKDTTIQNHVFCQLAHPGLSSTTTYTNSWRKFFVGLLTAIVAIIIVACLICIFTIGAPAWLIVAGVASVVAGALLLAACINNSDTQSNTATYLSTYYGALSKGVGAQAFKAKSAVSALKGANMENGGNGWSGTTQTELYECYDVARNDSNLKTKFPVGTGESVQGNWAAAPNAFQMCYSLYSPYGTLGTALGAVSNVYTANGIVNGNSISTKVGSYITNDVNLWGGIYYAYMVDIFGLTFKDGSDGKTMLAAPLKTVLPPMPEKIGSKANMDLSDLLVDGKEKKDDAYWIQKQQGLLERADELTDPNATGYISKWITNTLNNFVIGAHKGIVQASEADTYASVGGGTRYNGYSGYLATASLSEMPFTSWVVENYSVIYSAIMILIVIFGILLIVSGHRSIFKTILSVALMGLLLFIPRVAVDGSVAVSNNLAQSMFNDRFNFWAYVQHQQYMSQIESAEENEDKLEFLIVTNMQQAKDYYDSENGVTLKWMSPKKNSYWDRISKLTVEGNDSLNLSIFKWMMQGQFRQEIYSTDPLATYLYRPYNDIVMTARTNLEKLNSAGIGTTGVSPGYLGSSMNVTSDSNREKLIALTSRIATNEGTDADIKPAHSSATDTGGSGTTAYPLSVRALMAAKSSDNIFSIATNPSSFIGLDAASAERYAELYPLSAKSATATSSVGISNDDGYPTVTKDTYFLYSESPFYYFYNYFSEMADKYGSGSPKKLLLSNIFYKYDSETRPIAASNAKGDVSDGSLMDFMDLEDLFTYVIPGLQVNNYYVDEWTELNGREITTANEKDKSFKADLQNIWNMYAPWVDAMYECQYKESQIRSVGTRIMIEDAINPGSYTPYRNMVFSPADMQRNYVTDADLSEVEKRIMKVLENTYTDFMYLNNYQGLDDEVILAAMAMTATFNFNEQFSQANLINETITLYPVGFEVRNFSYDAYMRMALLNTTGTSIFSDEDIYTTVVKNTSFFTGLLIVLNDLVAVYAIPAFKLICMIALFFLGVLIVAGGFLNSPKDIMKFSIKQFIVPLIGFLAVLVGLTVFSALFVGEGLTTYVGSRSEAISTGDPTLTVILMLVVNVVAVFAFYKILRTLITSYIEVFKWLKSSAKGTIEASISNIKAGFTGGRGTVLAAAGAAAAGTYAANMGFNGKGGGSGGGGGANYSGNTRFADGIERRERAKRAADYRAANKVRRGNAATNGLDNYRSTSTHIGNSVGSLDTAPSWIKKQGTTSDGNTILGKTTRAERKAARQEAREIYKANKRNDRTAYKAERTQMAKDNAEARKKLRSDLRTERKNTSERAAKREYLNKIKSENVSNRQKMKQEMRKAGADKLAAMEVSGKKYGAVQKLMAVRAARSATKKDIKAQGLSVSAGASSYKQIMKTAKANWKNSAEYASFAEKRNKSVDKMKELRTDAARKREERAATVTNSSIERRKKSVDEYRKMKDSIKASKKTRVLNGDDWTSNLSTGKLTQAARNASDKARSVADKARHVGNMDARLAVSRARKAAANARTRAGEAVTSVIGDREARHDSTVRQYDTSTNVRRATTHSAVLEARDDHVESNIQAHNALEQFGDTRSEQDRRDAQAAWNRNAESSVRLADAQMDSMASGNTATNTATERVLMTRNAAEHRRRESLRQRNLGDAYTAASESDLVRDLDSTAADLQDAQDDYDAFMDDTHVG